MGAALCVAEGACCACAGVSTAFSCCKCCMSGEKGSGKSRYLLMLVITTAFAVIIKDYALDHINYSYWRAGCHPNESGDDYDGRTSSYDTDALTGERLDFYNACKENSVMFRASFALACFFAVMTIACLATPKAHKSFMSIKILLWWALYGITWVIPSYVFSQYAWVALIVSIMFLVLQVMVLIDFAHEWNATWADRAADPVDGQKWLGALVFSALACYVGWLVWIIFMFKDYDCGTAKFFISMTVIIPVIYTVIQVFMTEDGSLMTSGVVTLYSAFLCWDALNSNPDVSCNPNAESNSSWFSVTAGICLAVFSLAWTSFSASKSMPSLFHNEDGGDLNKKLIDDVVTSDAKRDPAELETADPEKGTSGTTGQDSNGQGGDDAEPVEPYYVFHLIMLVASLYMAMLFTDWGSLTTVASAAHPTVGHAAMWVKIASQWLTMLLYLWTLIAPKIFPDRDFS